MKDALVAFGMGGPDSIDSIKPFLVNMLNDREIINFGVGKTLQKLIVRGIASDRAKVTAPFYEKMGGGSPQLRLTEAFLKKLSVKYAEKTGFILDTYPAMCYWHPFVKDTLIKLSEQTRSRGYRKIILFPMYPQYSRATTGVCFSHFRKALAHKPPYAPLVKIYDYHLHPPYLDVLAERIRAAALKMGEEISGIHILFSAHSLPQSVIDDGDPYAEQIQEQSLRLAEIVKPKSFSIAYQSKFGRKKWLTPSVNEELVSLAGGGIKNVVLSAVSFINDHIETLIELDEELIGKGGKMGLNIIRAETPNDADDFAAAMADLLSGI
ncbi:MAG: ferrochelatase [Deferribacteraceae bacterium]|jgi:ferrochelatase|nr:ferrochelatase [Deferribacteraceae bacterium]